MLARLPTSSLPLASLQSKPLAQSETRRHTCCCVQQRPTIWCSLLCGSALGARARTRRSKKCASKTPETHPAVDLFRVPDDPKIELEVLGGLGHGTSVQPVTLLLIHGSYHAAWCYEEHFLSFFREQGFHTYALSLRGQGSGKMPRLPVAGTLEEHASDIAAYVAHLRELHRQPVVVLGHSFGGLMVLQAARALKDEKDGKDGSNGSLAGLVLLCSVPPGGNVGIILRSLFKAPLQALRITWGFVARAFERDADLCQQLFFDTDTPAQDIEKYMGLMKGGCPEGTRLLDLRQLQKSLPVEACDHVPVLVIGGGHSPFAPSYIPPLSAPESSDSSFRLGDEDVIVDQEAPDRAGAIRAGVCAVLFTLGLQPSLGLELGDARGKIQFMAYTGCKGHMVSQSRTVLVQCAFNVVTMSMSC
ncbi:unnamed protein product [Symbiodinium natans]|uniref:AB hydrolase-1 domain-containing protein n=1 Tax=Symbiodinium natans TaxID=878477 RepID=A0A812JHH1_9DINO|nr:unnamed protein product [Symbiodinium natans]